MNLDHILEVPAYPAPNCRLAAFLIPPSRPTAPLPGSFTCSFLPPLCPGDVRPELHAALRLLGVSILFWRAFNTDKLLLLSQHTGLK